MATCFLCLLVGCPSSSKGRVNVYDTTASETDSPKVFLVALMKFSDEVPGRLIQDLDELPLISDSPERVTVIMGDINNKTQIVSSDEFELVRSRIRNNLLQNKQVRRRIRFVENQKRMGHLRRQELKGTDPGDPQHDAENAYVLNGDFYRIQRGRVNQYYMEFLLVHFETNEIVFSGKYDVKQQH